MTSNRSRLPETPVNKSEQRHCQDDKNPDPTHGRMHSGTLGFLFAGDEAQEHENFQKRVDHEER